MKNWEPFVFFPELAMDKIPNNDNHKNNNNNNSNNNCIYKALLREIKELNKNKKKTMV